MHPRALTLKCPHCFVPLELHDRSFIGKRAGCPKCEQAVSLVADPQRGVVGILPSRKTASSPLVHGILSLAGQPAGAKAAPNVAPASSPKPKVEEEDRSGPIDFPMPAEREVSSPPSRHSPSGHAPAGHTPTSAAQQNTAKRASAAPAGSVGSLEVEDSAPVSRERAASAPKLSSKPVAPATPAATNVAAASTAASKPEPASHDAAGTPVSTSASTGRAARLAGLAVAWLKTRAGIASASGLAVVGLVCLLVFRPWGTAEPNPSSANAGSGLVPSMPAPPEQSGIATNPPTQRSDEPGKAADAPPNGGDPSETSTVAANGNDGPKPEGPADPPPVTPPETPNKGVNDTERPPASAVQPGVAIAEVPETAPVAPTTKPPVPKPATVKPVPKDPVNVAERLKQPIARFEQTKAVPARDLIGLIEEMLGVPVKFDRDELGAAGISLEKTISLRLQSTTVGDILQAVADKAGLKWEVDGEAIRLRSK